MKGGSLSWDMNAGGGTAGIPLRTPSLLLRHFVPEDAAEAMALNAEPTTAAWLPSHVYATPAEAEQAVAYLIDQCADPADPRRGPYVLAVEHLDSGRLLGHVGFSPLDGEVEISYAIAQAWRGRGFGAEAVGAACAWAAAAFGLEKIVALTASANAASRRMLVRAGFVHANDSIRRFQGSEQAVSIYAWLARP
jgi:RimJ/RimL family protein N-acetyltransferase